jgi:chromosome segregation ATPase
MADDPKKKADDAKKSLEEIGEITGALEEGFRALTSRLSDIVDEIKDASSETRAWDLTYKDINRSVKSLSKITEDLVRNQVKINEKSISSKEIQTQINKKIAEQQILSTRIESLQRQLSDDASINENERIEKQNLINKLQKDFKELSFNAIEPLQKQKQEVEGTEKALEETNKKLGVIDRSGNQW